MVVKQLDECIQTLLRLKENIIGGVGIKHKEGVRSDQDRRISDAAHPQHRERLHGPVHLSLRHIGDDVPRQEARSIADDLRQGHGEEQGSFRANRQWSLQGDQSMRSELSMVSAALEPQDHEDFERVRRLKGLNKTDFLKHCIKDAIAIHDYNTMRDWHPTIVITRFEG